MNSENLFLFVHIEKAAGTTFHKFLRKRLGEYYILKPYPKHGGSLYPNQLADILKFAPFVKGLGGHRIKPYLNYEKTIDREIKLVTILRNPIERYLSHYNHHITRGIDNYSLEKFMQIEHFHNFQTKKIAGKPSFDEAIKQINKFFYVGTVTNINEIKNLARLNTGEYKCERNTIKKSQLQRIKELNKEDIKLYNYVSKNNIWDLNKIMIIDGDSNYNILKEIYIQFIVQNYVFLKNKRKISPVRRGY